MAIKTAFNKAIKLIKPTCIDLIDTCKSLTRSTYLKYFLIFSAIYIIALIPLLRANIYYYDDLGRAYDGYRNFGSSRETSNLLSILIHNGKHITDISPYTQILAAVILALASTIVVKLIMVNKKDPNNSHISFWHIIAALPIGLSPYFLENYSYKFDSPYMALSILCSIVPFLFYKTGTWRKNYLFIFTSIICTLIMCTTYQSSSGIFLSLAIILSLKEQRIKPYLTLLSQSIAAFLIGLIIFKILVLSPVDGYISSNFLSFSSIILGSIANYQKYFYSLFIDFRWYLILAMAIVIATFVVAPMVKSEKKITTFILSVLSLVGILLLSFGLYPFMEQPLFAPRAKYGIFINFAFIAIYTIQFRYNYISKICSLYIAYAMFICALTYGNLVNVQKTYASYRIGLVANDLNNIAPINDEKISIDFNGSIGYAKPIIKTSGKYPIILSLIPTFFEDDQSWWGDKYFRDYHGMNNYYFTETSDELNGANMELIKSTNMHDIYRNENNILVILKSIDVQ